MKRSRLAEEVLSLAETLNVKDKLGALRDADIREVDLETAVALGIDREKSAKLTCRIRFAPTQGGRGGQCFRREGAMLQMLATVCSITCSVCRVRAFSRLPSHTGGACQYLAHASLVAPGLAAAPRFAPPAPVLSPHGVRSLAREEDAIKSLNHALWAAARKGYTVCSMFVPGCLDLWCKPF
jgi:hypothetical protein